MGKKNKKPTSTCSFLFVPEMASSIFLRAPKVVMPSSFRSWSVRVRNVWRSIWRKQQINLLLSQFSFIYSRNRPLNHKCQALDKLTSLQVRQIITLEVGSHSNLPLVAGRRPCTSPGRACWTAQGGPSLSERSSGCSRCCQLLRGCSPCSCCCWGNALQLSIAGLRAKMKNT